MSVAIIGRASAAGLIALALGFAIVGALLEALEGAAAATALFGIGYVGEAHNRVAAGSGGKARRR